MIILEEFIWRQDHYAYHLTNTNDIKNIRNVGLKPLCGKRSLSIGDNIKGIFFFDYLGSTIDWIDALYPNTKIYELELLRFNLKNRKWIKHNENEFYLIHNVHPDKIDYLRIHDIENNIVLPLSYIIQNNIELEWNNLNEYKPLARKITQKHL